MLGCSAVAAYGAASLVLNGQKAKTKTTASTSLNKIKLIVDPIGVGEFQLDVQFDQNSLEFVGFEILGDYKFESIDLTKLDLGLVADVRGIYNKNGLFDPNNPSTFPPLLDGVDIFEVTFKTKSGVPENHIFTISPPDVQDPLTHNDFVTIVGPGPDDPPRTIPLEPETFPEPAGAASLLAAGMLATLLRRRRQG
jgi:hypothetical protein